MPKVWDFEQPLQDSQSGPFVDVLSAFRDQYFAKSRWVTDSMGGCPVRACCFLMLDCVLVDHVAMIMDAYPIPLS